MINAPRVSCVECHESGWIQKEILPLDFGNSSFSLEPPKTTHCLLDKHKSRTMNFDIINLSRKNEVHILATPPNSTNRLLARDVKHLSF